MDTQAQDVVSTNATKLNASHPYSSRDYQWTWAQSSTIYELGTSGTIGYINSISDVDIYHVSSSLGTAGVFNPYLRYLYIVTTGPAGSGPAALLSSGNIDLDLEIAQGWGPDDPYYSYLSNYSSTTYSLYSYYWDSRTVVDDWLVFMANNSVGVKYAIASTPQVALAAITQASSSETPFGPSATIADHTLHTNQWQQVSGWLSYTNSIGKAAVSYQFFDDGTAATSGYFFAPGNPHQPAKTTFTVAASDLSSVWLRGGQTAGTETMWVRAFDGSNWSAWDSFTLTTTPNTAPVVQIADLSLRTNQWQQISIGLISYSDADGDAATQYQFMDSGTGAGSGYFWTPGNPHHPANTVITVNASDTSSVWVSGGMTTGTETMWVRAFDGSDWSAWDSITLTTVPNTPPVATIADHSSHINQWQQISSWISFSDANGDGFAQFQFMDSGTGAGSGYFWTPGNPHHPANTAITVSALDTGNVWVRGGQTAGTETMWVRAFDGQDWSAWDLFTLTTLPNTLPVASIADHALDQNQWSKVVDYYASDQSWLSYSDADGDAVTQFQFWDGGTGGTSGYFWTPGNPHHPANTAITVAVSDLGNVWVRGGQTAGTETMMVRAFDGLDWGAWKSFTLSTRVPVNGGTGNDKLVGASTADALSGGLGTDILTGNGGSDSFIFNTAPGPQNIDQIVGFQPGIDVIELDRNVFSVEVGSGAGFIDPIGHTFTTANGKLIYNTSTGALFYDADGSGAGAPVQFATVSNHPVLDWRHDFVVI